MTVYVRRNLFIFLFHPQGHAGITEGLDRSKTKVGNVKNGGTQMLAPMHTMLAKK